MNDRVFKYFNGIAEKLAADHLISATIKNSSDIGISREKLVQTLLLNHLPKRLSPVLGGHIFGFDQPESSQIDIIVVNDIGINFKENEKEFTPVENVAAAFSIKSTLDSANLIDALNNIASIPQMDADIVKFKFIVPDPFFDFIKYNPSLFIFGYTGVSMDTALETCNQFYRDNAHIPLNRRPCGIIVNKKYYLRCTPDSSHRLDGKIVPPYTFNGVELRDEFQGTPYFHIFNCISSYNDWLLRMNIDYIKYFNTFLSRYYESLRP